MNIFNNNKLYKAALLLMIIAISFTACIEEFGGVGEPFDRVSTLSGNWKLTRVVQVDEDAVSKGFPAHVQQLDLTNRFPYSEYNISLAVDEDGSPATFNETSGNAPSLTDISNGTWSVDNLQYPSEITFTDGETSTVLSIGSYNGLNEGLLEMKLTRTLNGKPFLSYNYTFEKE